MAAIKLKKMLLEAGIQQRELCRSCKVSDATIAQICNHGAWPSEPMGAEVKSKIIDFLAAKKMHPALIDTAFEAANEVALPGGTPAEPDQQSDQSVEDITMLLAKQVLSHQAKEHFSIITNPFGDLKCDDDMWISKDIRIVREHMYNTARHGGITAVVGESGAGKSSVRAALLDRIKRESAPIIIAKPYMLAAEDSDKKGKPVKITHISDAVLNAISPGESPRLDSFAKFNQLHRALLNLEESGQRACLLVDEAHSLSIPCLKHLKRLYELEPASGYGSLISIVLIGQPELMIKLSVNNPDIRELAQRCDIVSLKPIAVAELEDFIAHRMSRISKNTADIIDQSGIAAMAQHLVDGKGQSQLWPLLVGNFLIAAMNKAAHIGLDVIDNSIIQEVATWRK